MGRRNAKRESKVQISQKKIRALKTLKCETETVRKTNYDLLREELCVSFQLVFGWPLPTSDGIFPADALPSPGDGNRDHVSERSVPVLELRSKHSKRSCTPKFGRRKNAKRIATNSDAILQRGLDAEWQKQGPKQSSFFQLKERERDEVKPKKGRQGRSKEVREKKKREAEERAKLNWATIKYPPLANCPGNCLFPSFLEDHASGDMICVGCGSVKSTGGLSFGSNANSSFTGSKPYLRVVHFRQRIAQLLTKDPLQKDEHIEMIKNYIDKLPEEERKSQRFGKNMFSFICRELKLDPKIATHWMQIRKRLGITPHLSPTSLDPGMIQRLNMRYFCVSNAFQEMLKKNKKEDNKEEKSLKRNNVINLNYAIIQLIRLESEEKFREFAKYCPQLTASQQPRVNNARWRILMKYCSDRYTVVADPIKENLFHFQWKFIPLSTPDILNYFYFFP